MTGQSRLRDNRDFLRFFAGQFVTNAGDSLYTVAVLWLAFELTGSSLVTGALNAILLLPWLLQVFAGPLVDRLPLGAILVGSQVAQGVVVLVLPLAAVTGHLGVGVLFAVAPILMLATLVMAPMESALLPRIVEDEHLAGANSALATVTLGLDMVFDALGGAFIAVFGATALFLVDAVTFAVAALLFAGIALGTPRTNAEAGDDTDAAGEDDETDDDPTLASVLRSYRSDLRTGIDVLRGTVFVELVALTAVANFTTGVTLAILPAVGDGLGGPAVYGLLLGGLGVGRLVGSLLAPYLEGVPYGRLLLTHGLGAGCWVAAAFAPSAGLAVALFTLAWVPVGASGVLTATLNQRIFPADLLGRVSATKGTASGATLPVGSLVGGFVAESIGPMTTMALAASGFGVTAAAVLLRPRLRGLPSVETATPSDFDLDLEEEHQAE